jgi:transposase
LERWSRSKTVSAFQHEWGDYDAGNALGTSVKVIADKLNAYPNKVIEWRKRYQHYGIAGLQDRDRKERPKVYENLKGRLFEKLGELPSRGYSRWDVCMLLKERQASDNACGY